MVLELVLGNIRDELEKLSIDIDKFLKKEISQKDWKTIEMIFDSVNRDRQKIIDAPEDKLQLIFNKTIEPFALHISSFFDIIFKAMDGNISKVLYSDRYAYERIVAIIKKNAKVIGEKRSDDITSILDKWMDYSTIASINLIRNLSQFTVALKQINTSDFVLNSYGTLLSLTCLMKFLRNEQVDSKKFDIILELGIKYSDMLESYADTLDILCSPDEKEIIKNIDNKQIPNN